MVGKTETGSKSLAVSTIEGVSRLVSSGTSMRTATKKRGVSNNRTSFQEDLWSSVKVGAAQGVGDVVREFVGSGLKAMIAGVAGKESDKRSRQRKEEQVYYDSDDETLYERV